jgi:hypothetical protein
MESAASVGSVCFPQGSSELREFADVGMNFDPRRALALAELLQMLSCGEESATETFENLACSSDEPGVRSALMQIAADERRHQALLARLCADLPRPSVEPVFQARMRRFFMRLAHRDMQVHFVRIAALDSAACQLLALLRSRTGPLSMAGPVGSILRSIHLDEARHVSVARRCAGALVNSRKGVEIAAAVRIELTELIRMRADSLEALGIDYDRLRVRLYRVPTTPEVARCAD